MVKVTTGPEAVKDWDEINHMLWTIMAEAIKTSNMAIIKTTLGKIRSLNLELIRALDVQAYEVAGLHHMLQSETARAEKYESEVMKSILKKGRSGADFQEYLSIVEQYIKPKTK
jgi:hypothetical protein